jgi:sec-independent protein translocase protein TatB
MFDIGFSEILLIFVLALVVLGPEKLPRVAAQVGRWIGRARGMARQFREQLEEEVTLEEARRANPPPPPQAPSQPQPAPAAAQAPSEPPATDSPGFSHAHPTDAGGRPIEVDPRQHDWVGGVTVPEKPPQSATDAAYAPPHERGT